MMPMRIGFTSEHPEDRPVEHAPIAPGQVTPPRKSVVRVYFEARNMTLAYYNDRFDLHCGDLVYVDGKLEGLRGRVTGVNYNFRIRVADYQRVIALVDTAVSGRFYMAGSHFVTFDRAALPAEKVRLWYLPPAGDDEEIVSGSDDTTFRLDDLAGLKASPEIVERGKDYFDQNRVRYLCIDGTQGYALVEGSEPYEVEFEYSNGEISSLTCSCFCNYSCKHEVATLLQLWELLKRIEEHYAEEYERSRYFAAIFKPVFFAFAIDGRETGSFTL